MYESETNRACFEECLTNLHNPNILNEGLDFFIIALSVLLLCGLFFCFHFHSHFI